MYPGSVPGIDGVSAFIVSAQSTVALRDQCVKNQLFIAGLDQAAAATRQVTNMDWDSQETGISSVDVSSRRDGSAPRRLPLRDSSESWIGSHITFLNKQGLYRN